MHSELESPKAFWYWAGLAAISAVVKDNVWINKGGAYKLYPNIYVMLHADSGLKKGPPVGLAKDLVRRVNNTRIISGRSSIQGILKELGTSQTSPGKAPINKSVGFICASEFSSSLVSDPAAMTILTDLYDRQYNEGDYKSLLKMESFSLRDPTLSMLVATNEAHFEDFVQSKDLHGGFIGRMFVIAETATHTLNPLIAPVKNAPDREELVEGLQRIAKLQGEFHPLGQLEYSVEYAYERELNNHPVFYNEIGAKYHDWYMDFYQTLKKNKIKDDTGTIQRFGDSVLKVAMLLSMSETYELVITENAIDNAIEICEKLIGNVRKTTLGRSKKSNDLQASVKALILKELLDREPHEITKPVLTKKLIMYISSDELENIMQSFNTSGLIETTNHGNMIVYKMPDKQVEEMKNWLRGRS